MDGLLIPPSGGPARHGDALTPRPAERLTPAQLRDKLGRENCSLISNACRFMGMQAQIRRDPGVRQFYEEVADFFQGPR